MKYVTFLLLIILAGCSTEPDQEYRAEIFETEMGIREIYGVKLRIGNSTGKKENKGYQVSLIQNDKVWIDTVYAELVPGDTVEAEVIFYEALTNEPGEINYKIEPFAAE